MVEFSSGVKGMVSTEQPYLDNIAVFNKKFFNIDILGLELGA